MEKNQLYYGDNLFIMREYMKDESVDLIYLDPPFNSNRDYNVIFSETNGRQSESQIRAFTDTWRWGRESEDTFEELVLAGDELGHAIRAFRDFLGENDMMAYLLMMAIRLKELHRVLKPTGSIYLHCDPTASHYLKIIMDVIFGRDNFRNEVIWHYGLGGSSPKQWASKHDILLMYSKTKNMHYTPLMVEAKSQMMKGQLKKMDDVWDIPTINNMAKERLGYPTQKPEALLERIIQASSREGDVVFDPFCGCGTAVSIAQKWNRRWIGIDITHLSVSLIKHRLISDYGHEVMADVKVIGEPNSITGARELARDDPFQFQWWILGLVGARPVEKKKGGDKGIDGCLYYYERGDIKSKPKQIIFSVKGGKTNPSHVRELRGVIEREDAPMGVLLTLHSPSKEMEKEASIAGSYQAEGLEGYESKKYPRIQILTAEQLLSGITPQFPPFVVGGGNISHKKAPRKEKAKKEKGKQTKIGGE